MDREAWCAAVHGVTKTWLRDWTDWGGTSGKEPICHAGDIRNSGSVAGSGRSPGGRHGNPLQYSCLENPPCTGEPGGLQFIGLQRIRHYWSDLACTHIIKGERDIKFKGKKSPIHDWKEKSRCCINSRFGKSKEEWAETNTTLQGRIK